MRSIQAVLFDLDGTLLDTAPDLSFALNKLRKAHGLTAIDAAVLRPKISLGSKEMIKYAFGIEEQDPRFTEIRKQYLDLYHEHLADETKFFPQIEEVLSHLEENKIPWGIVTNKLTRHTVKLLESLNFHPKPVCVICGDTLPKYKPDPAPILHACQLLSRAPADCLFVGDSAVDVKASKAAGTESVVALYGYISQQEDPYAWLADGYINEPIEILSYL